MLHCHLATSEGSAATVRVLSMLDVDCQPSKWFCLSIPLVCSLWHCVYRSRSYSSRIQRLVGQRKRAKFANHCARKARESETLSEGRTDCDDSTRDLKYYYRFAPYLVYAAPSTFGYYIRLTLELYTTRVLLSKSFDLPFLKHRSRIFDSDYLLTRRRRASSTPLLS
jgi:hypothetical protein